MANLVEVRVTAFIPDQWIYFSSNDYGQTHFEGNNRTFTYFTENQSKLYKMAQHVVVNFTNQTVKVFNDVGPTRERFTSILGKETFKEGQTDTKKMSYTTTINSNQATIYLRGAASNPNVNLAPDIDWEYNITVTKNGQVTVVGAHDGYPNHEMYKRVDQGTPVSIFQFNKQTLASLVAPMEHSVNISK